MTSTKPVRKNASYSIRDNLDLDSNITEESDRHSQKQNSSKISTDERRMISTKPVPMNANFSIRSNFEISLITIDLRD
jgi:hypothetical protein